MPQCGPGELARGVTSTHWAGQVRQKSARRRAEAHKLMEREEADTAARQEKVDHKLRERLGQFYSKTDLV